MSAILLARRREGKHPEGQAIEIRSFSRSRLHSGAANAHNAAMESVGDVRERARSGDLRGATKAAHEALAALPAGRGADRAELLLVAASCAMRQGHHADALRELEAAERAAARIPGLSLRVEAWRAEHAYLQGRYSAATDGIGRLVDRLEAAGDHAYAAFALRTRIAIHLARAEYDAIAAIAPRALAAAERGGDDYVLVQVLNVLGAVHFDRATAKLADPHARSHLTLVEPHDAVAMEDEAREALAYFQRARDVAGRAHYEFAAWYVAGNIERLEIVLGHADRAVRAIRKRLKALQARGATYDEIVTRSNLAWALRTLGRHRDALHELDVALGLARETGTFNVLLEFLHYDRSVVLEALGDRGGARAAYRRYLRMVGAWKDGAQDAAGQPAAARKLPLEPFFLKRADRFIAEHLAEEMPIAHLARHCGVSWRTLQKAFTDFRGLTPVAHVRNMRLDEAHRALEGGEASVADAAARVGFHSSTTFALEYRKRFGVAPSRTLRAATRS
jgi:AraC-like DNA-binding protein